VSWLRRLVSGLSTRRPGFEFRTVHLKFVVYTVALFLFPPSTLVFPRQHYCTTAPHSIRLHVAFTKKTNGQSLGTLRKRNAFFRKERSIGQRSVLLTRHNEKTPCPDTLLSIEFWSSLMSRSSHVSESSPWNPNTQFALVIVCTVSYPCVGDTLGNKCTVVNKDYLH